MTERTPTPWNIDYAPDSNYGCQIAANVKVKAKRVVCRLGGPDREANATFIVKAVNSHDALVATLKAVAEYMRKDVQSGDADLWTEEYDSLHADVIAALSGVAETPSFDPVSSPSGSGK